MFIQPLNLLLSFPLTVNILGLTVININPPPSTINLMIPTILSYRVLNILRVLKTIPFVQLLHLQRICQDDDDFLEKSFEMLIFFFLAVVLFLIIFSTRISIMYHSLPERRHSWEISTQRPRKINWYYIWSSLSSSKEYFYSSIFASSVWILPLVLLSLRILCKWFSPRPEYWRFLFHSHLPSSTSTIRGTILCNYHNCKSVPFILQTTFISFPPCAFHIKNSLTCISRNIIYTIIVCKRCGIK